jgi:predicted PurR-regulated permease PerM
MSKIQLFGAWFFGGLSVGFGLLWLLNPMAGLATLIIVVSLIAMFIAPLLHMFLRRRNNQGGSSGVALGILVISLVVVFFLLIGSGAFNFT